MIPEFDERGYLPPGIHGATLAEIEARFGKGSELRQVQMQSIYWLVDVAKRAGVERLVTNGSFVTDTFEPNDVDCALLAEPGFPQDVAAENEILRGLPFLDIALVPQKDFEIMIERVHASDREYAPKGMVEVIL